MDASALRQRRTLCVACLTLTLTVAALACFAMRTSAMTHADMDEEQMKSALKEYFSTHPEVGLGPDPALSPTAAFADTFKTPSLLFDTDGNTSTPFDSTSIFVDEAILWINTASTHTVTSGIPGDPNVGSVFNMSLGGGVQKSFTFTTAGRFPFFCNIHPGSMRGVVNVKSLVGVTPVPGKEGALGFVSFPSPNPSVSGVTVRFALREAGPARLEVIDVRGRVVARLVDDRYGAGTYAARWDRGTLTGTRAPAGVYFLLLTVPGAQERARVVIAG